MRLHSRAERSVATLSMFCKKFVISYNRRPWRDPPRPAAASRVSMEVKGNVDCSYDRDWLSVCIHRRLETPRAQYHVRNASVALFSTPKRPGPLTTAILRAAAGNGIVIPPAPAAQARPTATGLSSVKRRDL